MIFTKEEFEAYTPLHGMVVVEVGKVVSEDVNFKSGVTLSVIAKDDQSIANQSVRFGTVVRVPANNAPSTQGYPFTSPIEIEEGDTVYWSRYAISRSMNNQSTGEKNDISIEVDGKVYITIIYPELVLCKRGDRWFGLNDHVVCETIPENPPTFLHVPESAKKAYKKHEFIVRYAPLWTAKYTLKGFTNYEVEEGQTVLTTKNADAFIEDEYHQTLPGRYVAFPSRMICAVLEYA